MVFIKADNKIRNVKLTGDEINRIVDELERVSHNVFEFMQYGELIKKLREAKDKGGKHK